MASNASKIAFKILAKANRLLLPRLSKLDFNNLSKADKVLIAYKYWVVLHVLD